LETLGLSAQPKNSCHFPFKFDSIQAAAFRNAAIPRVATSLTWIKPLADKGQGIRRLHFQS
jgi:hypothetical protein